MLKMPVDILVVRIPIIAVIIHLMLLGGVERNVPLLSPMSELLLKELLIKILNLQVKSCRLSQIR